MQFEDPKSLLEAAAAKPERGLDAQEVMAAGRRLRRARLAAGALGLAVVVAGASASFGFFGDADPGPGPAGDTAPCEDRTFTSLSIYLHDDAAKEEVAAIATELRDSPDVESVEYVSKEAAYEEFREVYEDEPELWENLPADALPASFRVEAVDEAAAERIVEIGSPAIDEIAGVPEPVVLACLAQPSCDTDEPVEVRIFVRPERAEALAALREELERSEDVVSVTYRSREDAYRGVEARYEGQPELLEAISPASLPAALVVEATDVDAAERLARLKSPAIEEIASGHRMRELFCTDADESPPAPTVDETEPPKDLTERREPRDPAEVDLLSADCGKGKTDFGADGLYDSDDGTWCRFVVRIENHGDVPLVPDVDAQILQTQRGNAPPWDKAMERDQLSRTLFAQPIAPGRTVTGQLVYRIGVGQTPVDLMISTPPEPPHTFPLAGCFTQFERIEETDCVFTQAGREEAPVDVTLYHCGVDPLYFGGRRWVADPPPFDATNAPGDFTGKGYFTVRSFDRAVYVDALGARIHFRVLDGWEPPPCA